MYPCEVVPAFLGASYRMVNSSLRLFLWAYDWASHYTKARLTAASALIKATANSVCA